MKATLTSKGQITVPVKIREQLNLRTGDKLDFQIEGTSIKVSPARKKGTLEELMNILPRAKRSYTVEEMNEGIAQGACDGGS
ncbi:AbrB/MazE/SpoVT family DNA-binding domain-containing protein [Akkermansiaceae bacterium]|nr:AbrB/MazE/SpoVT family DNA-binding domain-containing protein [Akkermansiaceae bacterium]